jgi:hypothetical protein
MRHIWILWWDFGWKVGTAALAGVAVSIQAAA